MHSRRRFLPMFLVESVGVLLLLIMVTVDAQAVTLCWAKTYNGASNGWDAGHHVAVAARGSIYVTGITEVAGQSINLLLRKYSPTGALRWTKTYNGPSNDIDWASGVAVAANGSVYVTGYTYVEGEDKNLLLQKYSPAGALLWTQTYNGASNGWEAGSDLAVTVDGSIYVTGISEVAGQSRNLLLQRYSPAGALLWTQTYNGASNDMDWASGVAVGADGSIYVTGYTYVEGQSGNLLLQKYSPAGALLWTQSYNGASNDEDHGEGVAVAADGSIYVAGYTSVEGQARNLLLQKYSPAGALLWTQTYNGAYGGWDTGHDVAVATDGSVHVAGDIEVAGQAGNLLLLKYSRSGALRWKKTYNGASNSSDAGFGVAVAADGSIYVTGRTYAEGRGLNLLLRKYK